MRVFFCTILAVLAWSGAASAEVYRFNVPVRIENMRFAEHARVRCTVNYFDAGGSVAAQSAEVPVTLTAGAFSGTVPVAVTLVRSYPILVRNWACSITFDWRTPEGVFVPGPPAAADRMSQYTRETGQAIASSSLEWSATPPR